MLEQEVHALLRQAEAADQDDHDMAVTGAGTTPRRLDRLQKIREAKVALECWWTSRNVDFWTGRRGQPPDGLRADSATRRR